MVRSVLTATRFSSYFSLYTFVLQLFELCHNVEETSYVLRFSPFILVKSWVFRYLFKGKGN